MLNFIANTCMFKGMYLFLNVRSKKMLVFYRQQCMILQVKMHDFTGKMLDFTGKNACFYR